MRSGEPAHAAAARDTRGALPALKLRSSRPPTVIRQIAYLGRPPAPGAVVSIDPPGKAGPRISISSSSVIRHTTQLLPQRRPDYSLTQHRSSVPRMASQLRPAPSTVRLRTAHDRRYASPFSASCARSAVPMAALERHRARTCGGIQRPGSAGCRYGTRRCLSNHCARSGHVSAHGPAASSGDGPMTV